MKQPYELVKVVIPWKIFSIAEEIKYHHQRWYCFYDILLFYFVLYDVYLVICDLFTNSFLQWCSNAAVLQFI